MPPKRKLDDTTMLSGSSGQSSGDSSTPGNSDSDAHEDQQIYYESGSRTLEGRTEYTTSLLSFTAPASPSKHGRTAADGPLGGTGGSTWIYDFMDNDWTFSNVLGGADEEVALEPPSSGSETEGPKKREPVHFFIFISNSCHSSCGIADSTGRSRSGRSNTVPSISTRLCARKAEAITPHFPDACAAILGANWRRQRSAARIAMGVSCCRGIAWLESMRGIPCTG